MDALAQELNQSLAGTELPALMSDLGRRMYFPRGVVAQTAEAGRDAHRFNATVGMATAAGQPLFLDSIRRHVPDLTPAEIFAYAPTAGLPELRTAWSREIRAKNPSLDGEVSVPVVTTGLTHGIVVAADLFVDRGDRVLVPDLFWGNYRLIVAERREAQLATFPLFDADLALALDRLEQVLSELDAAGKAVLILNFPNNPTGYTPTNTEMDRLAGMLTATAERGVHLVVICDDAYFGLFYEEETCRESLFARIAHAHERLLAIKVDGATKEDYVWGFRVGFLTFSARGLGEAHFKALEQKVMGAIRSSVSNSNMLAQSLLLRAMGSPTYAAERAANLQAMADRYQQVRRILRQRDSEQGSGAGAKLRPLPFNSGYFLTLRVADGKAEVLRQRLLHDRGVGTISVGNDYLRVAFSTVDTDQLEALFDEIYTTAATL